MEVQFHSESIATEFSGELITDFRNLRYRALDNDIGTETAFTDLSPSPDTRSG